MKTSHLIALTATIVVFAAPTASARPATDSPGSHRSQPTAVDAASIAAHREQISNEQWQRSQASSPATPLEDRTGSDGFPVYVLIVLAVALGIGLMQFVGKPAVAHSRRRRVPTRLA